MLAVEVEVVHHSVPENMYLTEETPDALINNSHLQVMDFSVGCFQTQVQVALSKQQPVNPKLFISDLWLKKHNLPTAYKLAGSVDFDNNQVKVGPFLGFLIVRNRKIKKPPHSTQRHLLELFCKLSLKSGVIPIVFAPQDINWLTHRINGFTMRIDQTGNYVWVRDVFPFPNVVYNRILNRTTERRELVHAAIKNLRRFPGLQYFNPRFLNKWETHQMLTKNSAMAPYLPNTILVKSLTDIANFIQQCPVVYIKPINGSLGKNIVKIHSTPEGFKFDYRKNKINRSGIWSDNHALWSELNKLLGKRHYVVQKGLDLIKYQDHVFDIRLLLQKDGTGQWKMTSTVGRVAADNSIFPNIAAGGKAVLIDEIWRGIADEPWEGSKVQAKVMDLGLNVPVSLEAELGNFAELGLDIGIDKNLDVWLIEVNSKPSRKVFPKNSPHLKINSIKSIIDYAKYLSGFIV